MSNATIERPGPAIWAWVIAIPISSLAGQPVWWPYWVVHILALYVAARWALDGLKAKAGGTP